MRVTAVALLPLALLVVYLSSPASALLVGECQQEDYRFQQATIVVTGTVTSVQSGRYAPNPNVDTVRTTVTIENLVFAKPAGQTNPPVILTFYVPGGAGVWVEDYPSLSRSDVGKTVKAYLWVDPEGNYAPVCAGMGLQFLSSPTEQPPLPDKPYEYTVKMLPGWNLFSVPVFMAGEFAGVRGPSWSIKENTCGNLNIWHYDTNIKRYAPSRTLENMLAGGIADATYGYWAKSRNSCKIVFQGNARVESLDGTALQPGWNQVGAAYIAFNANALLQSCSVTSGVWYYDNPQKKWVKAIDFEPGKGYFVKVSSACSLKYGPFPLPTLGAEPYQTVVFSSLVDSPTQYDGQNVCVDGYYGQSFEFSALVGERPVKELSSYSDLPFLRFKAPYIWNDGLSVGGGMTALEDKVVGAQASSYQKVRACGKFAYSAGGGFGHVGAYEYRLSTATAQPDAGSVAVNAEVASDGKSVQFFATNEGTQPISYVKICVLPKIQRNVIDGWLPLEIKRAVCAASLMGEIRPGETVQVNSWDRIFSAPDGNGGYSDSVAPAGNYRFVFSYFASQKMTAFASFTLT